MSTTTILVDKKPVEIPTQPLCVLVHQFPAKIEAPGFFEINGRNTIDCVDAMRQEHWDHIRTGGMFKPMFDIVFVDHPVKLPEKLEELKEMDDAVKHVTGLIILMFEHGFIKGEKIFLRLIEAHMHPAEQRHIMTLIHEFQKLCGGKTNVIAQLKPEKKKRKKTNPKKKRKKKGK